MAAFLAPNSAEGISSSPVAWWGGWMAAISKTGLLRNAAVAAAAAATVAIGSGGLLAVDGCGPK